MLPNKYRGLGKGEIDAVFTNRSATKTVGKNEYLTVLYRQVVDEQFPRFAIMVSKKIANKAVTRNRIRRLIFDQLQPKLTTYQPGHYVMIVHKDLCLLSTKELSHLL